MKTWGRRVCWRGREVVGGESDGGSERGRVWAKRRRGIRKFVRQRFGRRGGRRRVWTGELEEIWESESGQIKRRGGGVKASWLHLLRLVGPCLSGVVPHRASARLVIFYLFLFTSLPHLLVSLSFVFAHPSPPARSPPPSSSPAPPGKRKLRRIIAHHGFSNFSLGRG